MRKHILCESVRGAIFIHQIKMTGLRIKICNHIVPMFPPYRVSSILFFLSLLSHGRREL